MKIIETKAIMPILPSAYFTGKVEQVRDYEKVSPVFVAKRGNQFVQEEFIGEQAVLNAKRKGLVVLSGCARLDIPDSRFEGAKGYDYPKSRAYLPSYLIK